VVGDGARVPAGVDAGHVVPVADLKSAFAATPAARLPTLAPDDPVCIVWTTAGPRRATVYDHAALGAAARSAGVIHHDRLLVVCPFSHPGYMGGILAFLAQRAAVVIGPIPWSAPEALRLVAEERVTAVYGDAARCADLRARAAADGVDLSRVRAVVVGEAPAPPATFDKNAPTERRRRDLVPGPSDHTAPSGGRP
jgi:acyl-CoA synthetase (AMP-forming)/AMP-acid ligase II